MCQSSHAIVVGIQSGQQGSPAWRAGWADCKAASKNDSLLCQFLQVGRGYWITIRLYVLPGVVGMEINDVWLWTHGLFLPHKRAIYELCCLNLNDHC